MLCQVGLQEGPDGENSSLVDKLMLYDSKLWKGEFSQTLENAKEYYASKFSLYCIC